MSRVIAVIGPTASGKTALGIALAQRLGGEVVNADALQCYRGMDIGTAKPTLAERHGIPHHCLDLWDPGVEATVQMWRDAATEAIEGLETAILVGGSGLHVRALLDGWELPGTDPAIRARLEEELATLGPAALHQRLRSVDPQAAADILPSNGRRIVRALEVNELGHRFQATLPAPGPMRWDAQIVGLDPDLETVDERIALRTQRMFDDGLVEEARGLRLGRTAAKAIGYAQALRVIEHGLPVPQAVEETAQATRRYVRRQRSWWRRDPRVHWSPPTYVGQMLDAATLCDHVLDPPRG